SAARKLVFDGVASAGAAASRGHGVTGQGGQGRGAPRGHGVAVRGSGAGGAVSSTKRGRHANQPPTTPGTAVAASARSGTVHEPVASRRRPRPIGPRHASP